MLDVVDRWFLLVSALISAFVALKPDRTIRILSYGRKVMADVAPGLVLFVRVDAAVVALGTAWVLLRNHW